ncbi:MAG TPA: S8 family peptidase [Saprospiraceae bacterium]|nr:S8 family peptidase [Saprospiraceae bacterium]
MKSRIKISLFFIGMIFLALTSKGQAIHDYVEGEIIIQMKPGVRPVEVLKNLQVSNSRAAKPTFEKIAEAPFTIYKLKLSTDSNETDQLINVLRKDNRVLMVQKNRRLKYRSIPNDPLYNSQWQFKNTQTPGADYNIEAAWDITTGGVTSFGDTIVVAVLEDGIGKHDDIIGNLWKNHHEIPGDKIDNDGNGFVDDYNGWNIATKNDDVHLDDRHGTSVAGIIGAQGNNEIGVSGVNWHVKIMSVVTGDITEANVISAYSYVYTQRKLYNESNGKKGAFIVATNSSWGIDRGKPSDAPIWCSFYDSLGSVGILNCAATINESINVDEEGDLPTTCSSNFLIAVTNINRNDIKTSSSGFGKKNIDIGAFGDATYNVTSGNRYATFTGTSAATPHVAGAIALAYSVPCSKLMDEVRKDPANAALFLKQQLLSSAKSNASLAGITSAQGRLDIGSFITKVNNWCNDCSAPLIDDNYNVAEEGKLRVSISEIPNNVRIDLRIRVEGSTEWTMYENVNTNTVINGLQLCNDYEYQLKSTCGSSLLSDFQYSRFITSFGCCPQPVIKSLEEIDNVLYINLEEQSLVDMNILEIREKDAAKWESISFDLESSIDELENCKLYEYRLSNSCLDGRSFSPISNANTFNTDCGSCTSDEYCNDFNFDNDQEWISSVGFGGSLWESAKDEKGLGLFLGYKVPKLERNKEFDLEIIPGFLNQTYQEFFKVYIDLDQNKAFSANELLYKSETRLPFVRDTILIPADAKPGITRMRVIMSFDDNNIDCNLEENFGEIEEYCVEILQSVGITESSNQNNQVTILNTIITNNEIGIKTSLIESETLTLSLYGLDGRMFDQQKLFINAQNQQITLNTPPGLNTGLYILNIQGKQTRKSFKVLKP